MLKDLILVTHSGVWAIDNHTFNGNHEYRTLAELDIGQSARISEIRCEGEYRRRLLDLGLIPGTLIKVVVISPLGNPVAYRFRGSLIALRKEDASKIIISKLNHIGVDKIR